MSDKPTGVFVRLPLSDEQRGKIVAEMMFAPLSVSDAFSKAALNIGTPVTGGDMEITGYIPEQWCLTKRDGTNASTFEDRQGRRHTIPLIRQSDAQAQIAALEAEVVRLREYYEASEVIAREGFVGLTEEMFMRKERARKALKGDAA